MNSRTISDNNSTTTDIQTNAFYDTFRFNKIDDYEQDLLENELLTPNDSNNISLIDHLYVLPPYFSRFDDPVNYSFKSEPNRKVAQRSQPSTQPSKQSPKKRVDKEKETTINNNNDDNKHDDNKNDDSITENENETQNKSLSDKDKDKDKNESLLSSARVKRSSQAILVTFNCKEIPLQRKDVTKGPKNEMIQECIIELEKLFATRPIYLKSVLFCVTKYSPNLLKESLPYVAYYFTTGP
jgi:hypothetical protein